MSRLLCLGLALGLAWWGGCASVPESKLIPVMGYADAKIDSAQEGAPQSVQEKAKAPSRVAFDDSADALAQTLLLLPFRDHSKYEGPWDIYTGIPRGLGDSLQTNDFYRVVPLDSVIGYLGDKELRGDIDTGKAIELGRQVGADYVVLGDIKDLSMKRFRATVPIGGYRNYKALVEIYLSFYKVIDGRPAGQVKAEIEHDSPRYGIANPAAHVPLDREYYFLGETPWGTEEFHQTLVGQGVGLALVKLRQEVAGLIKPPPELTSSEPKIIDIDAEQAYINIGLADSVQNGAKYGIWDHGRELRDPETDQVLGRALPRRVGVVQVEQVLADQLSVVRILEGADQVKVGFTIRAE